MSNFTNLPVKMSFPKAFLEPEVRCNYVVDRKHKAIWAIELDLLSELLRVCSRYNIKVQVYAGTLLGAARHKGFIPWDDDLDVVMSYADYCKLCRVAENEFQFPYFFQTGLTDRRYFFGFARLRNTLTTAAIKGYNTKDYNNGIFIDINIFNVYPVWTSVDLIKSNGLRLLAKIIQAYVQRGESGHQNAISRCLFSLWPFYRILPLEFWYRLYHRVACGNIETARYVGLDYATFCRESRMRYKVERRLVSDTILLDFEMLKVPASALYDEVLSSLYGNWHALPPIGDRGKWHEGEIHFDPFMPYHDYLSLMENGDDSAGR